MKSKIFEEIKTLKEDRAVLQQNRDEYLVRFKEATKASDEAFGKMAFCRDQMVKARRERYRVRGESGLNSDEYKIADAVYQDSLENYKREDADFREKFEMKRQIGYLYHYYKDEAANLSREIRERYDKLPKKSSKKPPTNNTADE